MTDNKQSWRVAGSLLLAATTGFPALAQDLPFRELIAPTSERTAPTPANNDLLATELPPAESVEFKAHCSPGRRDPISRWRQRCCARTRDKFWGYPWEFDDAPLGAAVEAHLTVQIAGGQAARMILYQYDFIPLSDQLKPRGKGELARIAYCVPSTFCPILVEPTPGQPKLDEARRQTVWRELASSPYPVPSERVVIGRPLTRGLGGAEALVNDRNRLMQTLSRGAGAGGGAGSISGSGSGASGGANGSSSSGGMNRGN